MLGEKKIETTLFGELVTLDFGLRFSGRLRSLYPNYEDILESGDPVKLIVMIVRSAIPESLHSKTEDDVIDELDSVEGSDLLINRCMKGFNAAMGFLAVALKGTVDAVEAVEKGAKNPRKR